MYNSEEVYTFEENKQTQSQHPSTDEYKNGRLNNSRPKNSLFSAQKPNGISGTYARIVPKRPLHDMERLYAENIQLRERIRFLEEDCTKIKTRVSMAEKQKQQLINQLCSAEYGNNVLRDRRPSQKGLVKAQQKPAKTVALDQNRKILHGYKDEISKLKVQNGRLKKTVKYTQIQELETENKLLHEEMARMKRYMQDVIENTEYDEYEKEIQVLNKQLQGEKDSKKNIQSQMKKKDEEIQDLKNKVKIIANRKSELEKKYNREITSVKSELHRAKEKEREYFVTNQDKKETSKPKYIEKIAQCKKCQLAKENLNTEKQKIRELSSKLSIKQKQLADVQNKLKQSQAKNSKPAQSPKKDIKDHKQTEKHNNVEPKQAKKQPVPEKNENKSPPTPQKDKHDESRDKPILQSSQKQSYDEDNDDYDEESEGNGNNYHAEQSEDKVDVFHVNLSNEKDKQSRIQSNLKNNKTEEDVYKDQFDQPANKKPHPQDESQEEVLFQKQDKKTKKKKSDHSGKQKRNEKEKEKEKQKEKEKEKEKEKAKQSQKEKGGATKAQKILKETIKYRLMAQRYSYADFHRDIKQSGATQFTIEELIQMLTNQPFFLSEQHLKLVLYALFQKDELDEGDTTTTNSFLKKMKSYIGEFEIKDEAEEQLLLKSIQSKLSKKKVLAKMKQQAINQSEISKKGFVKVLKQFVGLNEGQIEQCLAEASVLSIDIAHINYPEFLQKLGYS